MAKWPDLNIIMESPSGVPMGYGSIQTPGTYTNYSIAANTYMAWHFT